MRSATFALVAGLVMFGAEGGAQQVRERRLGFAVSAGVATIPDALGAQCGANGGGSSGAGVEASGAAVLRFWRWMVVQGDARTVQKLVPTGCTLMLFPVDTAYAPRTRREPFTTSTLRVGVETPPGTPLVRATAGIGRVWGSPALPIMMYGVAVGTRGRRVRFVAEVERLQTRADAEEVRNVPGQPAQRTPIVVHPVWHSVRLGAEVPLAR